MKPIRVAVKQLRPTDIGALREMTVAFNSEMELAYPTIDEAEIDQHMLYVLATIDEPTSVYRIAYDGKRPAGFLLAYIGVKPYSRPRIVAVAQELYVVPNKRGSNVGWRLMESATAYAIEKGVQGLECIGTYGEKGTAKRWEKLGFTPHIVYGHMENDKFMKIARRFAR